MTSERNGSPLPPVTTSDLPASKQAREIHLPGLVANSLSPPLRGASLRFDRAPAVYQEQPVVAPQLMHLRQVPFRTS